MGRTWVDGLVKWRLIMADSFTIGSDSWEFYTYETVIYDAGDPGPKVLRPSCQLSLLEPRAPIYYSFAA